MRKLEVFFDYTCPYCLRGHEYLEELRPEFDDIEVVWRPCEAHPRPERHGPHSDLCIQGLLFAMENGVDIDAYNERLYRVVLKERIDIEDADTLAAAVADLLNADALRAALRDGTYERVQREANVYAFEKSGVWAVPSYRMDGKKLDAVEGVGVTKEQLRAFMAGR